MFDMASNCQSPAGIAPRFRKWSAGVRIQWTIRAGNSGGMLFYGGNHPTDVHFITESRRIRMRLTSNQFYTTLSSSLNRSVKALVVVIRFVSSVPISWSSRRLPLRVEWWPPFGQSPCCGQRRTRFSELWHKSIDSQTWILSLMRFTIVITGKQCNNA